MSYEANVRNLPYVAAADLSAAQYKGVKLDTNGKIVLTDATSLTLGILQTKPLAGQVGTVAVDGVSKILLGGTVAAGARVMCNASGLGIAATTAGNAVIGIAQEGGVSGDIIPILIDRMPFAALA